MKLLNSNNLSNLTNTYQIERGQFEFFLIRYTGVAQAGQTVTLANCGNAILNWNGEDKVNVDIELLSFTSNLYGGFIENNSAVGGAFNFSVVVPCGAWFDRNNIYDIGNQDKVYFKLDFPAMLPALIASGTVTIYGKPRAGVMNYWHKILSKTVVAGGAGAIVDTINQSNIAELYIKNPAALVSNLIVSKDGKTFVNGDAPSELAYSNWLHLVEQTGTFLAVEFAENADLMSLISNTLEYNYTFTGAGNLAQYYSAIQFSEIKQQQSLNRLK